jgi:hypothetical protein
LPRTQSQSSESESDFGSKHGGEGDQDPSAKVSADFSHGLDVAMAGVYDKAAKHKDKKSKEPWADRGFGHGLDAAIVDLHDTDANEVVEEVVVEVVQNAKEERKKSWRRRSRR